MDRALDGVGRRVDGDTLELELESEFAAGTGIDGGETAEAVLAIRSVRRR